ncbi:stage V sporulation protein E [Ammoniphilus resinae]|uniref:Cell division protein FtsW n=1 Tax=Ammoniphilus resinae TaxID=861532 RepID=A0ABS4GUZ3_9BACL|nr:cell division protein FtsW [Ammoniphilus resinae]
MLPKWTKVQKAPDQVILLTTFLLLSIGIVMVYSSSAVIATGLGDSFYFTKRQLLFAGVGLFLMFLTMNIHYSFWQRWAWVGLWSCSGLLLLVLLLGKEVNGAKSWFGFAGFGIQPAEFVKMALILFLANWFAKHQQEVTSFRKGLLPPLSITFLMLGFILLQPDLGTAAIVMGTVLLLLFVAGCRLIHVGGLIAGCLLGVVVLTVIAPYRVARITSFLDPWKDPWGSGYQLIQSLYAIGPGKWFGLGLGMSRQKFYYLPEPHNDFIFSILSEELGFVGASMVIVLFFLLLWRGIRIAILAPDSFASFLAVGIIGLIAIQVCINVSVVTGLFPVTGITLPFLSYGGSSLVLLLASIGILLNISRYAKG